MRNETFVVERDDFPSWFNEQALKGRCKVNKDDEGNIVNVVIHSPTGKRIALPGDSIMNSKSGLLVIKEEAARKYNVQGNKKNVGVVEDGKAFKQTT